jgi:hypothetical protein
LTTIASCTGTPSVMQATTPSPDWQTQQLAPALARRDQPDDRRSVLQHPLREPDTVATCATLNDHSRVAPDQNTHWNHARRLAFDLRRHQEYETTEAERSTGSTAPVGRRLTFDE